jgi:hypothetical protein
MNRGDLPSREIEGVVSSTCQSGLGRVQGFEPGFSLAPDPEAELQQVVRAAAHPAPAPAFEASAKVCGLERAPQVFSGASGIIPSDRADKEFAGVVVTRPD